MADKKISEVPSVAAQSNFMIPAADPNDFNAVITITAQGIADLVGGGSGDFQPAIVDSRDYGSQLVSASGSSNLTADRVTAYPIWFSHDITWTRIKILVDTPSGAASKIRLGIWENGADNRPAALLLDSGELDLNVTGALEATISELIPANTLVWIGQNNNDAGTTTTIRGDTSMFNPGLALGSWLIGDDEALDYASGSKCFFRNLAYGALPDPFGTPDGIIDDAGSVTPAIWLRKV